jgi:hypothetical protein
MRLFSLLAGLSFTAVCACNNDDSSSAASAGRGGAAGQGGSSSSSGGQGQGVGGSAGLASGGAAGSASGGLVCYGDGIPGIAAWVDCASPTYRTIACSDGRQYRFTCKSDGYPTYTACKCSCAVDSVVGNECSYATGTSQSPCMTIEGCGFPVEVTSAGFKTCTDATDCPAFLPTCYLSCGRSSG